LKKVLTLSLVVICLASMFLPGCFGEETKQLVPPLLPPGFEDSKVPNVDLDAYFYIAQGNPFPLDKDLGKVTRFLGCLSPSGSSEALWERIVFTSSDDAQVAYQDIYGDWKLRQDSDLFLVGGQGSGAQSLIRATTQNDFIPFKNAYPDIYEVMNRLPTNPPGKAIGAGFIRSTDNFNSCLREITEDEEIAREIIDTLEEAKMEEIVFGVYSEKDLDLSVWERLSVWEGVEELGLSALLIGKSSYPGLVISQVLPRVGLTEDFIDNEKIYVATFDSAQVAIKSVGSYIYISVAPKLEEAKYLLRTALVKLDLVSLPEELEKPSEFWVEVANTGESGLRVRQNFGTEAEILKVVPDGWVLYVTNTHQDEEIHDGYTWWEVRDVTDGIEGWAANQFLRYDEAKQKEWKEKTKKVISVYYDLPDKEFEFENDLKQGDKGKEVAYLQFILREEGCFPRDIGITGYFGLATKSSVIAFQEKYHEEILAPLDLTKGTGYVGSSTRAKLNGLLDEKYNSLIEEKYSRKSRASVIYDAVNQFSAQFLPEDFPPELILAVIVQEAYPEQYYFDNEYVNPNPEDCGRGIMQITTPEYTGIGSGIKCYDNGCERCGSEEDRNDCKCYYTNTIQGIEANIKDGLKVLSIKCSDTKTHYDECGKGNEKWSKCAQYGISCEEMRWISAVQRYHGYFQYPQEDPNDYLKCIGQRLRTLSDYFTSIDSTVAINIAKKVQTVWNNQIPIF